MQKTVLQATVIMTATAMATAMVTAINHTENTVMVTVTAMARDTENQVKKDIDIKELRKAKA